MLYHTSDTLQKARFISRANFLADKGAVVDLTERRPLSDENKRTVAQSNLCWMWFGVFADEVGYTAEEAHDRVLDAIIGRRYDINPLTGKEMPLTWHLSDMSKQELSDFMDKFKALAQTDFGIYLPYFGDAGYDQMVEQYGRKTKR